ncbi:MULTISPECIES: PAS domain-containing sensor histidine kinase [unclassified Sphingomonas]|uniref:hybrid sensor histidine kinase/response regulator n=1 Tax=unclassified Sphingomonas TaxID=196159 RepID=UPI00226A59C8|nr:MULTISPECIES: PAS domain-containing sensor histidine kinase [unclassified Sphingomonas]
MTTMRDGELATLILQSATDFAIISLDRDGMVTSWNPGAEHLLGWSSADIMGQSADVIFTPEDRAVDAPQTEMALALDVGKALDERWHMRSDGSRIWGSGLMMPLLSETHEHIGFTKIMRDRTVERESDRRYNALTAALPGFQFVSDPSGDITDTNAAFQSYTGLEASGLDGAQWLDVLHVDDRAEVEDRWREAMSSGEPCKVRGRFRDHAGDYRSFACQAMPDHDGEGRIIRWMGTCLDVDADARARIALERLTLALEHKVDRGSDDLAASIENVQAEIAGRIKAEDALRQAQKMEAVGQLTGGVAHDFNNLLTVIRGSADLLRRPGLPEERRVRYLDAIVDTAERAAKLTAQLLAFARRQPLKPEVFDVSQRLDDMRELLTTTLGSRVMLTINPACSPCMVLADPNQFDTAILNLAVNARDAMDGEGTLSLQVEEVDQVPAVRGHDVRTGRFVRITVCDTGPGIPPDQVGRVFEPFFTTKDVGKGTGLGLSQVHGFSKQSEGEIDVATADRGGAVFSLYLPHAPESATVVEAPTAIAPVRIGDGQGCILVVEDNEAVGTFATDMLAELGYAAVWARDAASGLDQLAVDDTRFDAVFSDIVMPGMSGVEFAGLVRDRYPHLAIVLTSGYSHILAQEGSHGFQLLQKPYSVDQLSRMLAAIFAEAS